MSAPPKTVIDHSGSPGSQRGILVALPWSWSNDPMPLRELGAWLGIVFPRTVRASEQLLRAKVNEHAATLPFPAACVVMSDRNLASEEVTDPLTVVTVLSKSSGHVYLRDKEPTFDRLTANAHVILLIPNTWSPA
jgi:hypothetical protein